MKCLCCTKVKNISIAYNKKKVNIENKIGDLILADIQRGFTNITCTDKCYFKHLQLRSQYNKNNI